MATPLQFIRYLADDSRPDSFANRLRNRRFKKFESLASHLPRPLRILDVGGTNRFWEHTGWTNRDDVHIVTLNLEREERRFRNIEPIAGDATNLSEFGDRSFEIVFSNSVIEHLFTFENQRRMAVEIQRVGHCYWVQTPNFWFPMEPHFQIFGWQWMPLDLRIWMIRRWTCGWRGPCPDAAKAHELVEEIRLLRQRELRDLFPKGTILPERFCGLVKSWVVTGGFAVSS